MGPYAYFGGARIPRRRASYAIPVQRTMVTRWYRPLGWFAECDGVGTRVGMKMHGAN